MSKKIQAECKHYIKNKYYCAKCGTLYDNGVRFIYFYIIVHLLVHSCKTL